MSNPLSYIDGDTDIDRDGNISSHPGPLMSMTKGGYKTLIMRNPSYTESGDQKGALSCAVMIAEPTGRRPEGGDQKGELSCAVMIAEPTGRR